MAQTVYTLIKNELRGAVSSRSGNPEQIRPNVQMSPRHEAMMDTFHPYVAISYDKKWLRPRLEARAPDLLKGEHFAVYLMRRDFEVVRQAVSVKLSDHEHLPDKIEGERTYQKVCRAKLIIKPTIQSTKEFTPIELTYSVNPAPRSSRTRSASPFYVAINFFEAKESPLPFSLSASEKVALMAMGAVRDTQAEPRPQDPGLRVTKRALRAFRTYLELIEARAAEAPSLSVERTSGSKSGDISHGKP